MSPEYDREGILAKSPSLQMFTNLGLASTNTTAWLKRTGELFIEGQTALLGAGAQNAKQVLMMVLIRDNVVSYFESKGYPTKARYNLIMQLVIIGFEIGEYEEADLAADMYAEAAESFLDSKPISDEDRKKIYGPIVKCGVYLKRLRAGEKVNSKEISDLFKS